MDLRSSFGLKVDHDDNETTVQAAGLKGFVSTVKCVRKIDHIRQQPRRARALFVSNACVRRSFMATACGTHLAVWGKA